MAERLGAESGMEDKTGSGDSVTKSTGECENETQSNLADKKNDDIDDLLDDALEDFDKVPARVATQHAAASASAQLGIGSASSSASATSQESENSQDAFFNKIFEQPDPAMFENFFSSLMSGDPSKLEDQFQSFSAASAGPAPAAAPGNITETLQQTIGSLMQNTQQLQDDNISEEEIMQMMSNMGLDGELPGDGDFLPMMQGMLKDLLSKDVLYPSLKEITAQYPQWLADNKDKVDEEQYKKYEEQLRLMSEITKEFEQESASDSEVVKRQRLEHILDLMQKMQELGHPPKEIVGDMPPGLELDEDGLPKLPTGLLPNPEQCSIM